MAESQTIYQREAPEIEALKIGLMEQAKDLTGAPPTGGLPSIQVAPLGNLEQRAIDLAGTGIGTYQPFLQTAGQTLGTGVNQLTGLGTTGANLLSGATQAFDPTTGVTPFMNPFQQAITDEINRAYDIQRSRLAQQQAQREGERAQKETLATIDREALDDAGGRDMIEESRRQAEEAEAAAAATKQSFAERQKAIEEKYARLLEEQRRRRR